MDSQVGANNSISEMSDTTIAAAADGDGQVVECEAVLEVLWERPWFYGMYWWKWHSDMSQGGAKDGSFTPRGKPAEHTLSDWYQHTPNTLAPR